MSDDCTTDSPPRTPSRREAVAIGDGRRESLCESYPVTPPGARIGDRSPDPAAEFLRLPSGIASNKRKRKDTNSSGRHQGNELYRVVLETALFPTHNDYLDLSPTPTSHQLMTFKSPSAKMRRTTIIDSPFRDAYSTSPLSHKAQSILTRDDFYLNLLDWSPQNVIAVGLGAAVYLWNAKTVEITKLCEYSHRESITSVLWLNQGEYIAVGTSRGLVNIYDVRTRKKLRRLTEHRGRVASMSCNEPILSTGSSCGIILQQDLRVSGPTVRVLAGHHGEVCGLKWNSDGTLLASGGNDNTALVWDDRVYIPFYSIREHHAAVKALAWSPHARGLLATGGGTHDRKIKIWNVNAGKRLDVCDTGSQFSQLSTQNSKHLKVTNLAWSVNANELVSTHGYSKNDIKIWRYPCLTPTNELVGHSDRVVYLATSPDERSIVTGGADETLRFWRVFKGRQLDVVENESRLSLRGGNVIR
ncbi:5235_t:CDS:2 [Paraglomus occultum]|uniref:5235_t:CDS:1 n=1 Tax=Paraglomus occultum TaxID=144539 RepID=A0A9N9F6G9_9GLOM|nr:5235_t:CDS:2 [Paraglomus occultum]